MTHVYSNTRGYVSAEVLRREAVEAEIAGLVAELRAVPPSFRTGGAAAADLVRARIVAEIAEARSRLAAVSA